MTDLSKAGERPLDLTAPARLERVDVNDPMKGYKVVAPSDAKQQARELWKLLDDIDTLDDACKGDDATFRRLVYGIQRRRFSIMSGEEYDALGGKERNFE